MEKKSIRIISIIGIIILGIFLILLISNKIGNNDALKFKEEYEEVNESSSVKLTISEDNPVAYLNSFEELDRKIKDRDSFILYLGFPTCPWCRNIIPVLFDSVKENNIENIYYINPRVLKEKSEDDFNSLYNLVYDFLGTDKNGDKVLYVPDVYFFKDCKIIGHHLDTVESQTDPSVALNEEQITELKNIYNDLIKKIK